MTGLRFKLGEGSKAEIDHLLAYSLLAEHIKGALRAKSDIPSTLQVIEKSLEFPSGSSPDLQDIYLKNGLQKAEEGLKKAVFEYIVSLQMHHVMKSFFAALVNTVNLLALYKHLKWGITVEPAFINGGSIPEDGFHRVIASRKIDEIVQLTYKQTGLSLEELELPRLESMLNSYLIRQTKRMEREGSDIGFILHYLWRCYIEARNLTVISYGKKIDKTIIKRELAY
jgi:vacuolar-type H+-ATPase subunit C/Vma6